MVNTPEVDEASWKARLESGARQLGVGLDAAQLDMSWRFARMLRERNRHLNLTSIDSLEGMLTVHMLDSLSVAKYLGDSRRLMDVGTGGGFPGVPLAIAFPDREFTLIDGTQKKIRFVAEAIAALGIRNAQAQAARAETWSGAGGFDAVLVRAVGSIAAIVRDAGKLLAPRGILLAMKGRNPEQELRELQRGWSAQVIPLTVPGLDAARHLVKLSRRDS